MPASWVVDSVKYYVRSSVLGGEVAGEVDAAGAKLKTFVRAAGSRIAYQRTSPAGGYVVFEYQDASAMSQRTTDRNAQPIATGDGGDGSPVETDPFGGNVGTSSPCVEQPQPWTPDALFSGADPRYMESPFYINRVHQDYSSRRAKLVNHRQRKQI